jgi:hypothetical protein
MGNALTPLGLVCRAWLERVMVVVGPFAARSMVRHESAEEQDG